MRMLPKMKGSMEVLKSAGYGPVGTTITAASGVMSYQSARNEGASVASAAIEGATDAFLVDILGWGKYLTLQAGLGAISVGKAGFGIAKDRAVELNKLGTAQPFSTPTFVDTQQTYTMRQSGLTQIQNNAMNTKKAVIGNEAMYLHK